MDTAQVIVVSKTNFENVTKEARRYPLLKAPMDGRRCSKATGNCTPLTSGSESVENTAKNSVIIYPRPTTLSASSVFWQDFLAHQPEVERKVKFGWTHTLNVHEEDKKPMLLRRVLRLIDESLDTRFVERTVEVVQKTKKSD